MYTVYRIRNTKNDRLYYGQTCQRLSSRLDQHRYKKSASFQETDCGYIEPLCICETQEEALELERLLVESTPDTYNCRMTPKGGIWNQETKGVNVLCIEDSLEFPSIRQANIHYNVHEHAIGRALRRNNGYVKKINKTFKLT